MRRRFSHRKQTDAFGSPLLHSLLLFRFTFPISLHFFALATHTQQYVLSDDVLRCAHVLAAVLFLHICYVDVTDYIVVHRYVLTDEESRIVRDLLRFCMRLRELHKMWCVRASVRRDARRERGREKQTNTNTVIFSTSFSRNKVERLNSFLWRASAFASPFPLQFANVRAKRKRERKESEKESSGCERRKRQNSPEIRPASK